MYSRTADCLLRQSICLHSQPPPRKLCVVYENSIVLSHVITIEVSAAITEGAWQPRRRIQCTLSKFNASLDKCVINFTRKLFQRNHYLSNFRKFLLEILLNRTCARMKFPSCNFPLLEAGSGSRSR